MVLHRNVAGNVFAQASIVNLFIPEGVLEPIPAVINWMAAVHLDRVSSLDCGREPKRSGKKKSKEGGGGSTQNGPRLGTAPLTFIAAPSLRPRLFSFEGFFFS